MDAVVLDAICARLQEQLYIKNSKIMTKDSPIKRMHFIVRGRMRSEGEDGMRQELSDGDYCGEELLFWYLEKMALKPCNVPFPFLPCGPAIFLILFSIRLVIYQMIADLMAWQKPSWTIHIVMIFRFYSREPLLGFCAFYKWRPLACALVYSVAKFCRETLEIPYLRICLTTVEEWWCLRNGLYFVCRWNMEEKDKVAVSCVFSNSNMPGQRGCICTRSERSWGHQHKLLPLYEHSPRTGGTQVFHFFWVLPFLFPWFH